MELEGTWNQHSTGINFEVGSRKADGTRVASTGKDVKLGALLLSSNQLKGQS